MTDTSPVCFFADLMDDGALRPLTGEVVTAGRQLADALGTSLVAVVLSSNGSGATDISGFNGVDRVVDVRNDALLPYTSGAWSSAASVILAELKPVAVLFPGSISGRDYSPRVAARANAQMVADVSALSVNDGRLTVYRSVLGGRVQTAIQFSPDAFPMMTVRPGAFPRAERSAEHVPVEEFALDPEALDLRATVTGITAHKIATGQSLADAKRIVSGGRGLQGPDAFAMLEELAEVMDAAVGASGAVVGAGWRSHDDQVGSTGHTVTPKLYLAVGISGAPQHLVGMQGSEYVVAINRDPDAPIFDIASFGIVGDLFEVVPALIQEFKDSAAAD
ncbi:MAG: electron transfer flavoprotein subunit alpha/FixB family protein [Thermomicrobiales bacterium]